MTRFLFALALLFILPVVHTAQAQEAALPAIPAPIQNLVDEGAQIRYLGKDHGMDAWITIKNGVEQYFYVMPDQSAFVMGVLFDNEGKLVTVRQVNRLRSKGDPLLDELADFPINENASNKDTAFEFQSPSEKMFSDIENSNWVALGRKESPVVYAFIDPKCPHCHAFVNDVLAAKALENGQMQLRLIPIGFTEETRAQAAFLIAAPNPQERWIKHMAGEADALPAKSNINQQGVQRNMAIMQAWKFDATPMVIYRGKDSSVKIVRGKPKDLGSLLADVNG